MTQTRPESLSPACVSCLNHIHTLTHTLTHTHKTKARLHMGSGVTALTESLSYKSGSAFLYSSFIFTRLTSFIALYNVFASRILENNSVCSCDVKSVLGAFLFSVSECNIPLIQTWKVCIMASECMTTWTSTIRGEWTHVTQTSTIFVCKIMWKLTDVVIRVSGAINDNSVIVYLTVNSHWLRVSMETSQIPLPFLLLNWRVSW